MPQNMQQTLFVENPDINTFDSFYRYVSTETQWLEDVDILTDIKAARSDAAFSSACVLRPLDSDPLHAASLFFFGRKAFSLSISDDILYISIPIQFISCPVSWCPTAACIRDVVRISTAAIVDYSAFSSFLSAAKLQCFRMLSPDPIGCCNSHILCSDALHCVKPHWLYSIRCYYRQNLENGRVFYGKNANIPDDATAPAVQPQNAIIQTVAPPPTPTEQPPIINAPAKGKSILACPDSYVAIDVETTGLDPQFDSIIELGAVRFEDGKEVSRFSSLVNPERPIDSFITSLTGITNDMLASAPLLADVLPAFMSFVGASVVVGHNVHFDINFIHEACEQFDLPPFSNDFVNTIRFSRRLYPQLPNHKLSTVLEQTGVVNEQEHRAAADASATAKCFEVMKRYIAQNQIKLVSFSKNLKAANITKTTDEQIDPDNPLYGKVCVFTGTLEKMPRRDAMQLVTNIGGICADGINKKTNFLIVGNNDYCASIRDGKSAKQKKAEALRQAGHDIAILSENVFYDLVL